MIKINLLGEDTGKSNAWTYGVIGYLCSVAVCLALFVMLYRDVTGAIADKQEEIQRLERQLTALKEQTKRVDELERKKELVNSKLALIAKLKKSKTGPVRMLDDLNVAVPSRVWLRSIIEKNGVFQIKGRAFDNQDIAQFLKNLEASDYFDHVELVQSVQMYYSKRTGSVQATPDLQSLRGSEQRPTKAAPRDAASEKKPVRRWSVAEGSKDDDGRRSVVDEGNVKIKDFLMTANVSYAGKVKTPAAAAEKNEARG